MGQEKRPGIEVIEGI
jgi:hypothetical protein